MILKIQNIECFAFHGCLEEESIIGGKFSVDIVIEYDFSKAFLTDALNDTIDYSIIYKIVTDEMMIASQLIEHVANRIRIKLIEKYSAIINLKVMVTKFNPPVNGFIEKVSVEV